MRKFRFKLESVLNLRKSRQDEALRALGQAQAAYQSELARKAELLKDLENALIRRESLGIEPIDIIAFRLEQDFIGGTKQRIVRQDQAILRASRSVEKALRAYLFARRQARTLELLEEKAYAEFRRALAKREQRELDDLTIMRARFKEEIA